MRFQKRYKMKKIVEIFIPLEAMNPNNAYKARAIGGKGGKRAFAQVYLSKEAKTYKETIKEIAIEAMKGKEICSGHIKAVSQWFYGTRRRKDLPNSGKLEYDALSGIVYDDDCQIMVEEKFKIFRKGDPGILIEIYEIEDYPDWKI